MASVLINPLSTDGPQQFDVTLDNVDILIKLFYSQRSSSWYIEIREPNTNDLIQGQTRLTAGFPLYFKEDDRLPPGQLFAITGNSPQTPIRLRDLGDTAFLWYQSPDDYVPPPEEEPVFTGVIDGV